MRLQVLQTTELEKGLAEPDLYLFDVLLLCFDILGREGILEQNPETWLAIGKGE